jgi:hypothetical protein
MGSGKFWAAVIFVGGIGWAWYTGLIPDFLDQLGGGMAPNPDQYIED